MTGCHLDWQLGDDVGSRNCDEPVAAAGAWDRCRVGSSNPVLWLAAGRQCYKPRVLTQYLREFVGLQSSVKALGTRPLVPGWSGMSVKSLSSWYLKLSFEYCRFLMWSGMALNNLAPSYLRDLSIKLMCLTQVPWIIRIWISLPLVMDTTIFRPRSGTRPDRDFHM